MDVITNKEVNVYLDNEKGTLCLTEISRKGTYVLVMSHPNCQPEVRRIIYSGI